MARDALTGSSPHDWSNANVSPILIGVAWRTGDTTFQTDAWDIADLASRGLLDHIHQCPRCGTWFLSKRERTPYTLRKPCSGNCRIALHRQKPEVKHKRAAFMRRRYREDVAESLAKKKLALKATRTKTAG
jgi:hypothetical protein